VPPKIGPRKILIASVGVATINYVAAACGGSTTTGDPTKDAGTGEVVVPPTSANLPAPPPTSANLPAPPPIDAGDGGDASDDGGDASDAADQ
jgi:hypothetical protein